MPIKVYEGRFGYEQFLFDLNSDFYNISLKDEFIFWQDTVYKVLYNMSDLDNNVECVFVRKATEEDF